MLWLAGTSPAFGQAVRLNEVMPGDATTLADEDGDYPGWLEIHNPGPAAVDLAGYGLSDEPTQPYKWTFPSVRLEPDGYLIVFTSGKNRRELPPMVPDPAQVPGALPPNAIDGLLLWLDAADSNSVSLVDGKVAEWQDKSLRPVPATGATPTTPDQVPGLALWLDGADTNTVVAVDGKVAQWLDKSGQTNHAAPPSESAAPAYAQDQATLGPLLRFNGSNSFLAFPRLTNIHTVIWVAREDAKASDDFRPVVQDTEFADLNRGEFGGIFLASLGVRVATSSAQSWLNGEPVAPLKTALPKELAVVATLSEGALRANNLGTDRLLTNRFWCGDIAEVIVFERELALEERLGVEAYLAQKWKPPGWPAATRFTAQQPIPEQRPARTLDPLTGLPVITFDGMDDFLRFPRVSGVRSLCWVGRARPEDQGTYRTVAGDSFYHDFHRGGGGLVYSPQFTSGAVLSGRTWLDGQLVDVQVTHLPARWTSLLTLATEVCSVNLIGSDRFLDAYFWSGDVGEFILFDHELGGAERDGLERYLRAKWQLPARYLHTSFAFDPDTEWLVLTDPQGTRVDQLAPGHIRPDLTVGRREGEATAWSFFQEPSPGRPNAGLALDSVLPEPALEPAGGFFTNAVTVAIRTNGLEGIIRYTLDGSEPAAPVTEAVETVWIEDDLPRGAVPTADPESWEWISDGPRPFAGALAHRSALARGPHQHYFQGVPVPWRVGSGDYLFAYVYLDPENPPLEIMLQWRAGGWGHRAFWGADKIQLGQRNSASRMRIGDLPPAGEWARLEVPARVVDLEEAAVNGMAFTVYDGQVTWDHVGVGTFEPSSTRTYAGPITVATNGVVRARVFKPGAVPSRTVTASYLVGPPRSLPVVSVTANPADLFDYRTGIYAFGPRASRFVPFHGANFWLDWERPAHAEFYEADGRLGFSLDLGIKIHGGFTRSIPQKSLRLAARRRYGSSQIQYPVFPERADNTYENLVLRNGGNDWSHTLFRDPLAQSLGAELGVDHQAARPVVLYLNGAYWGLYTLQERVDAHFAAAHDGVTSDQVDVIDGGTVVDAGDRTHYDLMSDFVANGDLRDPAQYAVVAGLMDVRAFQNYQHTEIFFDNTDWPLNNVLAWRPRTDTGKWRWILKDLDGTFDSELKGPGTNTLAKATKEQPGYPRSTLLLRKLLENDSFRLEFASGFADALNTAFSSAHVLARIDQLRAQFAPELPNHLARWVDVPRPGWEMFTNVAQWEANIDVLRAFARARPAAVREFLVKDLGLAGTANLTLGATRPEGGRLSVNRFALSPSELPWTGGYFQGIPVAVTATPSVGYRFSGWLGSSDPSPALSLMLTNDLELVATFEPDTDIDPTKLRPRPFDLFWGDYTFDAFPATAGARNYPSNMLFFQTAARDPLLTDEMTSEWVLPYDRSSKSRVRGLGSFGFSFVNTGETQNEPGAGYLGAAVLALGTQGVTDITVSWTGGTVAPNSRTYGLRLQYRAGTDGPFADVLDAAGKPVEYLRSEIVGDAQEIGPVALPAALENRPVIQLRWKYYYVPTVATGARAELRVDGVRVRGARHPAVLASLRALNGTVLRAEFAGAVGRNVRFESSTNLVDWMPAEGLRAGTPGGWLFEAPIRADWPAAFYRLWVP